jgi:hypothetical protein
VALSGDPQDILETDRALAELMPDDAALNRWLKLAGERVQFQGLPARICWLGYGERHLAGLKFNELVASNGLGFYPDWPVSGYYDILKAAVIDLVAGNTTPEQYREAIGSYYEENKP